MPLATYASVILARFDELTTAAELVPEAQGDALFRNVTADMRAAGTKFSTQTAFKFVVFGLHGCQEAANQALGNYKEFAPWLASAKEVWGASLIPYRHFGEANFVNPSDPGGQFEVTESEPSAGTPIVVVTSAGWVQDDRFSLELVQEFGEKVTAVRVSMTGIPGLHSQQTFSFPGFLVCDGITVTIWKDFAATRDFAYGPGLHRNMVGWQRKEEPADRTSFTRFKVLSSFGTWHGTDPLAW